MILTIRNINYIWIPSFDFVIDGLETPIKDWLV